MKISFVRVLLTIILFNDIVNILMNIIFIIVNIIFLFLFIAAPVCGSRLFIESRIACSSNGCSSNSYSFSLRHAGGSGGITAEVAKQGSSEI